MPSTHAGAFGVEGVIPVDAAVAGVASYRAMLQAGYLPLWSALRRRPPSLAGSAALCRMLHVLGLAEVANLALRPQSRAGVGAGRPVTLFKQAETGAQG